MTRSAARLRRAVLAAAACLAFAAPAAAGGLSAPLGLALDDAGNLYVANAQANNVTVYDKAFALAHTIVGGMDVPTAVAVAPGTGLVYVANSAGNNITAYDPAHQFGAVALPSDPALSQPTSAFVDPLGDLWVLDSVGDTHVYDETGVAVTVYPSTASTAFAPAQGWIDFLFQFSAGGQTVLAKVRGGEMLLQRNATVATAVLPIKSTIGAAAADAAGNLYITDRTNQTINMIAPNSIAAMVIASLGYAPYGIAVDPVAERLYVSAPSGNAVHVYSLKPPYKQLHVIR